MDQMRDKRFRFRTDAIVDLPTPKTRTGREIRGIGTYDDSDKCTCSIGREFNLSCLRASVYPTNLFHPSQNRMTRESERPRHRERRHRDRDRDENRPRKSKHTSTSSSQSGTQLLSADALSKLDQLNQREERSAEVTPKKERRQRVRDTPRGVDERRRRPRDDADASDERRWRRRAREAALEEIVVVEDDWRSHKRKKRRVVSGALLEEGDSVKLKGLRGGSRRDRDREDRYSKYEKQVEEPGGWTKKKKLCEFEFCQDTRRNADSASNWRWNCICDCPHHCHCCCCGQPEKELEFFNNFGSEPKRLSIQFESKWHIRIQHSRCSQGNRS